MTTKKYVRTVTQINEKQLLEALKMKGRMVSLNHWESTHCDVDGVEHNTHSIKIITEEDLE
jgi:hypothetical protein